MNRFLEDSTKNVAVFINDFNIEFASALEKLSERLNRPLRGITLVDKTIKQQGLNRPDVKGVFQEIVCDFSDPASLRQTIKLFEDNLLLVSASSERNQPYLQLALPHMPYILGPTETSLQWSTHKAEMRKLLGSYHSSLVPKVQHIHSADEAEIQKILQRLHFPVIIKPTGLAASVLVSKADTEQELRQILTESFSMIHDIYKRDHGRGAPSMIAEEFIEGDMYSVDVYVNETGTVWPLPLLRSKTGYAAGKGGFHIYQEDSFIELDPEQNTAGHHAAAQAVHALGLRSCVAHIELFHTLEGWKIIELGPRAGGQRQEIYEAAYGIDHAYNELLVKVGLEPEISTQPEAYITIIRLYSETEGILEAVEGLETAKANPSMYHIGKLARIGDYVQPSDSGGKAVIDGVLRNTDLEQLYRDAELVRETVKIVTKDS